MPRRPQPPSLHQRGDYWWVYWHDPDQGRRIRAPLGTTDEAEARVRFAHFLLEGREFIDGAARHAELGPLVSSILEDYEREHVHTRVVDKQRALDAIDHLNVFFGRMRASEITIPECRAYAEARHTARIGGQRRNGDRIAGSNGTIIRELTVLKAALNHAAKWGRIDRVPYIEKPSAPPPRMQWLFKDELAVMREAATGRTKHFIELAYWTGARRASVETLTVFQVNLATNRINLSKPGEQRTAKRRPIIAIPSEVRPLVEELMQAAVKEGNQYLLGHGGSIQTGYRWLCRKVGLETLEPRDTREGGSNSPHLLRHSRATHMAQEGKDLWAVANLLGDSVSTVQRVYGHHCPAYMEEIEGRSRRDG